jgi:AcrR family transcriptional regulator
MHLVAEGRLENFSCSKAAVRAGCTERLLFVYFGTKENLLYQCYQQINDDIAAMFESLERPNYESYDHAVEGIRNVWFTYLQFLVANSYRTLFYFEYCSSEHLETAKEWEIEIGDSGYSYFSSFYQELDERYGIHDRVSFDVFWAFISDATSNFAMRIIRGVLPNTEQTFEEIWRVASNGLLNLLQ